MTCVTAFGYIQANIYETSLSGLVVVVVVLRGVVVVVSKVVVDVVNGATVVVLFLPQDTFWFVSAIDVKL